MKSIMDSIALKAILFMTFLCTACAQNRPPSISKGAEKEVFILYDNSVTSDLICKVSGTPTPSVIWYINSQQVNLNAQNVVTSNGTLQMVSPIEGFYQCTAGNNFGTANSNLTWLRRLRTDTAKTPQLSRSVSVGDTLSLQCALGPNQIIVPAASYKWQTVPTSESQETRDIILDRRIQMDDYGNLKFAYVVADDQQSNRFYRCQLTNTESNILQTSVAFTKVQVNTTGQVRPTQLSTLFSYSWPSLALEREQVSLRCFFGGAQDIVVSWKKPDGTAVVSTENRYQIDISRLLISNLRKTDEGVYTCTGTTSSGLPSATATINLQIASAPYFVSVYDGPHDVNVTIGDDVVVNCNAYANPEASVSWFLNGAPIDSNRLLPKFKLSSDKKALTISKVCKTCSDGSVANSDLMVIQCNASNANGYIYGNGYINVLDRTIITKPPVNVLLDPPNPAVFSCEATSDVATVVKYFWTKDGQEIHDGQINSSVPGMLYIDISQDKGADYKGTWTCNATNGVSSASASAQLSDRIVGAAAYVVWPLWWIPFIVILLFLIFIALLLLICWCLYRNRGEAYPVDVEERKGGNDPVKELHEIGFHDFQRPMDAPDGVILNTPFERAKRGPGSISSSIGKVVSDDEMSLDNYSNINHGKFTEDGSFIGQYNPNRRRMQMTQPGIPESSA